LDKFGFFIVFYSLILGLAVTELLNGFGELVRAGELRRLGAQTALLALFLLIIICATWIDAWGTLRNSSLDFEDLWPPILAAILYYLAAVVTFPKDPAGWQSLDEYFAKRKSFVAGLLLAADFPINYTYRNLMIDAYQHHPSFFWGWVLPYNLAPKIAFLALIFVKGRRANIAALIVLILLYLLPYWHEVRYS
jgi:hypothetical protein